MIDLALEVAGKIDQTIKIVSDGIGYVNRLLGESNKEQLELLKQDYKERLQLTKDFTDSQVSLYKAQISQIDTEIKEINRQEKDEDYADKLSRLNAALKYENDEYNRYEIQKEIEQVQAEYQKRKRIEKLEDEKAALKTLIDWTKSAYDVQKDLYNQLLNSELSSLQNQLALKKELLSSFQQSSVASQLIRSGDYSELMNIMSSLSSYSNYAQSVNVYQTIQSIASSPSQLARETALALENALRYGL